MWFFSPQSSAEVCFRSKFRSFPSAWSFFIFHGYSTEDDGTNMKWCQRLFGQYLDQYKCAQCFPSIKSQKKPPWGTMWCCLLWPRIAKMKGLAEQRVFKTIPPFWKCEWGRKCGVYRGTLSFSSSVCLCVSVCPDRISRVKRLWLLQSSF